MFDIVLKQNDKYNLMKINQFPNQNRSLPKIDSRVKVPKYSSPFSIPDDAQIFRMKEKQKQRKREEKQKNDKLRIWEKGVKKQGITIKQLNQLANNKKQEEPHYQSKASFIEAAKNAIKNRVKVNEPMFDYIGKKRETLLFQMLIDHKRQKINQFEELTKLHKKGLERAEVMLDEDMENFNNYLAENKKQARDAIKKAETQTRKKNQKIAYIKEKLEIQADLTGKNMSKKQTLQNLKKYKNFLDSLRPDLSQQQRRHRQQKIEAEPQASFTNTMNMGDDLSDSQEQQEMYFKEPQQLASIFHSLEESNLFLITNLKEIEQEMDEVKNNYNHKKDEMNMKKNQLINNKLQLVKQIKGVDEDIEELKKTTNKDQITGFYKNLENQITKISKETAKESGQAQIKNASALDLFKEIEKKIQDQLFQLRQAKQAYPDIIKLQEKRCNEKRRQLNKKKNQQEMQLKALKQKQQTSPERQKRKGRPIMTRSIIKKEEKKKEILVEEPIEEIQRRKYLM